MCPERLVDIQKLEADKRSKLEFKPFLANIVQEESWPDSDTCVVIDESKYHDTQNFDIFEVAISSLSIQDFDSGW